MGRTKQQTHPVAVRNIREEKPRGISFDDAVDLLRQGYSVLHVAKRTGFPPKMLAAQVAEPKAPVILSAGIPVSNGGVEVHNEIKPFAIDDAEIANYRFHGSRAWPDAVQRDHLSGNHECHHRPRQDGDP